MAHAAKLLIYKYGTDNSFVLKDLANCCRLVFDFERPDSGGSQTRFSIAETRECPKTEANDEQRTANDEQRTAYLRLLRRPQQNLAGKRLGSLSHEHGDSVRYVRGLQHLLGIFPFMWAELGVHGSWTDDRNANVVGAQLFGDRVAQSVQAPFRRAIRGLVGQRVLAGQRRDVDDVSAARLDHQRRKAADAEVNAAQVRVEDEVPVLRRELMQRTRRAADAGVVDQNVDTLEDALDALGHRFHRTQIGDVALNGRSLVARVFDGQGRLFQGFARASA